MLSLDVIVQTICSLVSARNRLHVWIAGLGNTHLVEKEDIWNREKCDGVDQNIVSEVVESTVHGRRLQPMMGLADKAGD